MANALSRNPSHLPDASMDAKFNTHTMIPDKAVVPFVLPLLATLVTMSLAEGADLDLYSKVKFLQPLSKGYDRLLELACANPVGQPQGYHKIGPVLYHQGCLWVPEGTIWDEIMEANHTCPTAGHPGKNKIVELIHHQFSWKGLTVQVAAFV